MRNWIQAARRKAASRNKVLWISAVLLMLLAFGQQVFAKEYYLYGDQREGTRFKYKIYSSKVSLQKSFAQLPEEEQQIVRAAYSDLVAEDTPPFPKNGLKSLLKPYIEKFKWYGGDFKVGTLFALVNKDGNVTELRAQEGVNPEVVRYMTRIFKATEFDPGLCAGAPCDMHFQLEFKPIKEPELRSNTASFSETPLTSLTLLDNVSMYTNLSDDSAYVAPEPVEVSGNLLSSYPGTELSMARTGRVLLSFMVDKEGNVFEPIIEQVNNPAFSDAAMKWISKLKYKPATVNNAPIDSWKRVTARFDMDFVSTSRYVSTKLFNAYHEKFNQEVVKENPNQKKLQKYLTRLASARHGSHYAYELLSKARYHYATKFGSKDEQIKAIKEMMLSNDKGLALAGNEVADKKLIRLMIESSYYGEAIEAYYHARSKYEGEVWDSFKSLFGASIKEIEQLADSNQAFSRAVNLDDSGSATLPLLKGSFTFDQIQGNIEKLKLRCRSKFKELEFVANVDYKIPESWGNCQLQLLGAKNTRTQMIQL